MSPRIAKNQVDVVQDQPIVGSSPESQRLRRAVKKLAKIDSNVLIVGGAEMGKEFIARQIYNLGSRRNKTFVNIDCSALGKTVQLKDLYGEDTEGDEAVMRTVGLLEKANKGVLFWDNIGDMSPEYQEELLSIIRDKKFRRVAERNNIEVDIINILPSDNKFVLEIRTSFMYSYHLMALDCYVHNYFSYYLLTNSNFYIIFLNCSLTIILFSKISHSMFLFLKILHPFLKKYMNIPHTGKEGG